MRIFIAGDWHSDLHEGVMLQSLRRLGHDVQGFKWYGYFKGHRGSMQRLDDVWRRAQNKFVVGPQLTLINQDFITEVLAYRPDIVFVYRGTHIRLESLRILRKALPGCQLVGYNNDDPFSPTQPRYLWRHFMESIPEYDLILAYRHANLVSFREAGAQFVELMRSWYVAERNFPVELTPSEQGEFGTDVVFIGHYEPDQRVAYLEEIVRQGFKLRIFGPTNYWAKPLSKSPVLRHLAPLRYLHGADYNRALCGAKVALCFLSKLNRDTYTRRCFEIPATRTLLLSEYSDDLASLYREGVEADYFRTCDEMLSKIKTYVSDDAARRAVAEAGQLKVVNAGHDVDSRMRKMLSLISNAKRNAA